MPSNSENLTAQSAIAKEIVQEFKIPMNFGSAKFVGLFDRFVEASETLAARVQSSDCTNRRNRMD